MVNWQSDHFTFRTDEECRTLIRRNKEYLQEHYNSTTELVKEALQYVDNENGTLQDKIERLEQEEEHHKKQVTDKRQRRKELQEKKRRLEKKRRKRELEERVSELQEFEGMTQEDIEEQVINELIDVKDELETRQDVLDSKYEIESSIQRKLSKAEELNEKKKKLQQIEVID